MDIRKLLTKSFLERAISGVVLVILALAAILAGDWVLWLTLLVVSLIGMRELYLVFGIHKNIVGLLGYLGAVGYYLLLRLELTEYMTVYFVMVITVLLACYVFTFPRHKTEELMTAVFALLYVGVMLSFIYQVRMMEDGIITVWIIFLCSWISDTCAYLVGVTCGRHKMTPVLSPKKSVEGAVGGVVGSALLALLFGVIFYDSLSLSVDPRLAFPVVCGAGAIVSMIGDLAASAIKRNHGIKDYGTLIPGHGGILDRFDSVIFTAPMVWLLLQIFA